MKIGEAIAKILDEIAENIKYKRTNAAFLQAEEMRYYHFAYIVMLVLNNNTTGGVIPPADITDVILPPNTRMPCNFAYNVMIAKNVNGVTVSNATTPVTTAVARGLMRAYNTTLRNVLNTYDIFIAGNNLFIINKVQ